MGGDKPLPYKGFSQGRGKTHRRRRIVAEAGKEGWVEAGLSATRWRRWVTAAAGR